MTPPRLAAAAALLALGWPGAAAAQRHTAVLGFRSAPEGLSVVTLAQLNTVLWQRIAAVTEPAPLTEQQVAATLGTAALRNCASDTCMVQLGRAAGLARIVWGWGMPTPQGGYSLIVRVVDAAAGPLGQEEAGCPSCSEADMLAYFSAWDASTLAHATGLRSEPAAVPQPSFRLRTSRANGASRTA